MSSPSTTALKRRSCDRCHGQKIKCIRRGGSNGDACSRCLRLGVACEYSVPLPKGRPSTHRRAGGFIAPVHVSSPDPFPLSVLPWGSRSALPADDTPVDGNVINTSSSSGSATALGVGAAPYSGISTAWPFSDDTAFFQPSQIDPFHPSFSSWSGPSNSSKSGLWTDQPFNPAPRGPVSGGGAEANNAATSLTQSADTFMSRADMTPFPIPLPLSPNNSEFPTYHLPRLPPQGIDETEMCVKELSDLSVRLYPIFKMSHFITTDGQPIPGALLTATAFSAVKVLLEEPPHVKPPAQQCNFLHETFSTSRSLLDIMYRIQGNGATSSLQNDNTTTSLTSALSDVDPNPENVNWMSTLSCSASPNPAIASLPPRAAVSDQSREQANISNENPPPLVGPGRFSPHLPASTSEESGPHSISVCYLILACYTRLLHIYSTLITVLHDDVPRVKPVDSRSPRPWMVELRIFLLVQFITQLFERMQQVIKEYLSEVDHRLDMAKMLAADHSSRDWQRDPSDENLLGLGNVAEMERTVRNKLKQLQASL